jgi:hypothetical protein
MGEIAVWIGDLMHDVEMVAVRDLDQPGVEPCPLPEPVEFL